MTQRLKLTKLPFSQSTALIGNYIWARISEQLRSAIPVVLYLLAVQIFVLGVPVREAGFVALGVVMVVVGLSAFLEGLMLAVMPLGELCGVNLPRRVRLPGILTVVFFLGLLGTMAEPSIAVLQHMGASVMPWDAPLLFVLLGRHSFLLVIAIGVGVGIAFALGILRSLLGWSLKPVLGICVLIVLGFSILARIIPNLGLINGLAWDSGAITTSDVTVPLMLALGVGLSRMGGTESGEGSGFGSVALASLVPIVTVLVLALFLLPTVPSPMSRSAFVAGDQAAYAAQLFSNEADYDRWATEHLTEEERTGIANRDGSHAGSGNRDGASVSKTASAVSLGSALLENARAAARAVIPLALMLVAIVVLVLRRKIPWPDQTALGLAFCMAGMTLFTAGVEIGLLRLGNQSGVNLTSLFRPIDHPEHAVVIPAFDPSMVFAAPAEGGGTQRFFMLAGAKGFAPVPYHPERLDPATGDYLHIPRSAARVPGIGGWLVLLLVAFGLGFTTTLVEPAVAALGVTLENVTVGVFPRQRMVMIVSAGVGAGTLAGFAMLLWQIPLLWINGPLYALILAFTVVSSELFTGIAWDAGGATTASITTPLVLAVGAGLGGTLGAAESFGILTLASGFPILGVLIAGLFTDRRRAASMGGAR